ncbi:MAG: proline dehydrogenase [Flavobacterium sp.]|nr:MAG: proline dehydrogenase [Flavobacterium sp.]
MEKIFNNTQAAFALKTDRELDRAYFLFNMIKNPTLVKVGTALTKTALNLHLPVEGLIRTTVFDHFCGGVTERDCLPVVDRMFGKGVSSILDYSVEGKEDEEHFDDAMKMTLRTLDVARQSKAIPFVVFKPTGFGRLELYQNIGEGKELTGQEQAEWKRVVDRYDAVCSKAAEADILVLIDAEETWMQDAADDLVAQMMQKYNRNKAVVFNTLQLYRHDRINYLQKLSAKAEQEGFFIGMKLVRGAYMEKENERAAANGYPTPICATKEETDANFDACVSYMMQHLDRMSIFAGTHNETSSYRLMEQMKEMNLPNNDHRIWFGQLYGMSDNISFNLAAFGYNVAKYLPFGPVREVMPYLIRRAEENTSVAGQTSRELMLIKAERDRRKKK